MSYIIIYNHIYVCMGRIKIILILILILNIFAGIPSTPVAFLEPDFEMKDCIFSLVIGLKSNGMGVGMLEVIR